MPKKVAEVKRKPGRPKLPGGPSVVVAVSLPSDVAESLDAHCKAKGVGKSAAVVEALRGWLKRNTR